MLNIYIKTIIRISNTSLTFFVLLDMQLIALLNRISKTCIYFSLYNYDSPYSICSNAPHVYHYKSESIINQEYHNNYYDLIFIELQLWMKQTFIQLKTSYLSAAVEHSTSKLPRGSFECTFIFKTI